MEGLENVLTSTSMDPDKYVSARSGSLFFANVQPDDANTYTCAAASRKWTLDGQQVEKKSSEFQLAVDTACEFSVLAAFWCLDDVFGV